MYRLSDQCSAPRVHNSFPLTRKGVKLNYMWQVSVILPRVHQNEQHCQARYNTMGTEYEHETKKGLNKKKNQTNNKIKQKRNLKCFPLEDDNQFLFIQTGLLTPTPSPLDFPIKGTYLTQPTVLRDHAVNSMTLAQIAFKQSPFLFFFMVPMLLRY